MNKFSISRIFCICCCMGMMVLVASCGPSKKATRKADEAGPVERPKDLSDLYDRHFVYNTFSGKAKMRYEGGGQKQSFTANLKMKKGETIWASIIALGIQEVARAQITPERLQAVERLSRSSYDMSFEEGVKKLNAPISFPMLENLLIGNPVLLGEKVKKTEVNGSEVVITVEKDGYVQTLTYDANAQTLIRQVIGSSAKKFVCSITYSDHVIVSGQQFAKTRSIKIEDKAKNKTTLLDMEFTGYELDGAVEFNFSIPSNYKQKSL